MRLKKRVKQPPCIPQLQSPLRGDIVGTRNAEVERVRAAKAERALEEEAAEQARRRKVEEAIIAQLSPKYETQKAAAAIVLD